ncbi:major facilitator superfamily transporter [Fusarium heterosporum]|uniref:Major facilitator superfamily transporter n=1 Tax=Fusarium heterosporum TaxID=42747 RepID=A0A8H5T792_FUSHE|nr:major facilitator superfamily transporter [Fusarium heterosporum]
MEDHQSHAGDDRKGDKPSAPEGHVSLTATEDAPKQLETSYVEGVPLLLVMGAVSVASFLVLLDTSIIATAIPQITSDFHSLQDISWYGSAYQLSSAAIQPLVGKLYTQFSLKWLYLAFFAIFEVGSLICGVAPSSNVLIVGRAIAGIGVAGLFAGGLTIIASAIRPEKRSVNMGLMMGVAQLGLVSGPLIGGAFTQRASWRWCFYINLPIGAIVLGGILFIKIADQQPVPPPAQAVRELPKRLDLVGFVLFAGASTMLMLALQWGGVTYAWKSAEIIGLFCGSGASLLAYVGWSWNRGGDSLIPPVLLKQQVVIACFFLTLFMMGSALMLSYWLPVYFQAVRGQSPIGSGVSMLPNILASVVFSVVGGIMISKIGYYLPQAVVGTALLTIATGLCSTFDPYTSTGKWVGYQFLAGVGRGLMQQVPYTAIPHSCAHEMIPIAMSFMVLGQYIGGSIFLALSNVVFSSSLESALREYAPKIDAATVTAAGASATEMRKFIPKDQLAGVVKAYSLSIDHVFYLGAGSAAAMFIAAFFTGWIDTRGNTDKKETASGGTLTQEKA